MLASIDAAYDTRSWHGTNLRGACAACRSKTPHGGLSKGRHNIWELMVHAAYWKYDIRRRLTGERGHSFAIEGSNFWTRPIEGT